MATLTTSGLGLSELAKRKDPSGNQAVIAEVLVKERALVNDAPWIEANDTFSNVSLRRSRQPGGNWRKLNSGVAIEKSDTAQVVDVIGLLESRAENDIKYIDSNPSPKQARNDEAMAFVEGLGDSMETAMIYSNTTTTPEKFTGLAPRLANISATTNVINEGGTGSDLTSIFVVTWGRLAVHMVYSKNALAGLQHRNLGIESVTDIGSNKFSAYVDVFTWDAGMVVRNNKCIGRLANIETAGSSNLFDEDNLITLTNRMKIGPTSRIYVNKTIMTQMQIALKDKNNVNYGHEGGEGLSGRRLITFNQIPIMLTEGIIDTETALT